MQSHAIVGKTIDIHKDFKVRYDIITENVVIEKSNNIALPGIENKDRIIGKGKRLYEIVNME